MQCAEPAAIASIGVPVLMLTGVAIERAPPAGRPSCENSLLPHANNCAVAGERDAESGGPAGYLADANQRNAYVVLIRFHHLNRIRAVLRAAVPQCAVCPCSSSPHRAVRINRSHGTSAGCNGNNAGQISSAPEPFFTLAGV